MCEQLTIFEILKEKENDLLNFDNIEILNKIEVETNFYFKNVKIYKSGLIDYWAKYKNSIIAVSFGINKNNKKYISVSYQEKTRGRSCPCESIDEAIQIIKSYFAIQDKI